MQGRGEVCEFDGTRFSMSYGGRDDPRGPSPNPFPHGESTDLGNEGGTGDPSAAQLPHTPPPSPRLEESLRHCGLGASHLDYEWRTEDSVPAWEQRATTEFSHDPRHGHPHPQHQVPLRTAAPPRTPTRPDTPAFRTAPLPLVSTAVRYDPYERRRQSESYAAFPRMHRPVRGPAVPAEASARRRPQQQPVCDEPARKLQALEFPAADTPAGPVLPNCAAGQLSTSDPGSTSRRQEPKWSADATLVKKLQRMSDEEFLSWRDSQNVSWLEVAEEDLPVLCRTCRLFRPDNLSGGTTIYDHMSSEKHLASIVRARVQAPESPFPLFPVPVTGRKQQRAGFEFFEAQVGSTKTARKKGLRAEHVRRRDKDAIDGMLSYLQDAGGNHSFKAWAHRSLSQQKASDTNRKEAIAREVAKELAKLVHWGEEDTRDYTVQEVASGDKFIARYTLGTKFP